MKVFLALSRVALLAVVIAVSAGFAKAGEPASPQTLGPFLPAPALALYIVGDGKPLTAHLTIRQGAQAGGDRLMIREFDPDEHLVLWKYIEPGQNAALNSLGDGESAVHISVAKRNGAAAVWYDTDIRLDAAGVYQIRVVSGSSNASVSVSLSRQAGYGVSFQNGDYSAWPGQPSKMYAYIPPHAEELNLMYGPVRVADETGALAIDNTDATPAKAAIKNTGVVWTFDFPSPNNWKLRAWGFPVILCPTAESARAIHASVDVLPDGTAVTWKFQARIAELLPKMLDPKIIGTADQLIVPLASRKDEWLKDPIRNQDILSPYCAYTAVEEALRNQNVDPASNWFGATGSIAGGAVGGWKVLDKLDPPLNRWDRLKSVDGLLGGASPLSIDAEGLAFAATLNEPFNPYYGNKALLYRAAAASMRDLMALGEDEIWRGDYSDDNSYPGFMAFTLEQKTLPVFAMAAPLMPADMRAVWTEGMRHIIDRDYPDGLVMCRNQSSHCLPAFQQFADGSGLPQYRDLARSYALRFVRGMSPAGYATENAGPDCTYTGISHFHMALYYRMTGDPAMAEALRKSYQFFNYTVAPEPDGKVVGASNFAHRTAGGFDVEQYSGARGIANDLPEVGLWAPADGTPEQQATTREAAVKSITQSLNHLPAPQLESLYTPRYLYANIPVNRTGVFPANESGSFIRDIGGELVAVKRPAYYLAIYVGHPAPDPYYIHLREHLRQPLPLDAEDTGGLVDAHGLIEATGRGHFQCTPFLGGGLSLFQTPAYGNAVIAANWSPLVHNGLVAVRADGARYWEDYFATKYHLDTAASTLTVTGQIEGEPVRYVRSYQFDPSDVQVHVTLTADKDVSLARLFETIPITVGAIKARGVLISAGGQSTGKVSAATVQLRDNTGAGVDIVFGGGPRPLQIQPNGLTLMQNKLQIGRVEVDLPATMNAGQTVELTYRLVPVGGAASAVTQ